MSKHDFPIQEFSSRRERVQQAADAQGLDWLILVHPVSIHWLTGSDAKSYQAFQCLLVPTGPGGTVMLTRESERCEFEQDALIDALETWGGPEPEDPMEAFARVAGRLGLRHRRVGLEVPASYLHPVHYMQLRDILGKALVAEPTTLVPDLKLVKSPAELVYIREAARIADQAMTAFAADLQAGRSELELSGSVYHSLLTGGSGLPASPLNLVSGDRAAFSHGAPTDRRLCRGDAGTIEFGATRARYTATIGRPFSLGAPSPRLLEIYEVVRQACDACIAVICDGVPAVAPHEAAKQVIAKAGLGRGRVHTSGYGLSPGFPPSWGEPLNMFGDSTYTLAAGMVVSVVPSVFLGDERLGVRIVDNVLVTRTGAQLLSRFPRDILVAG
jgi:Xaa-Pro dipeptidase